LQGGDICDFKILRATVYRQRQVTRFEKVEDSRPVSAGNCYFSLSSKLMSTTKGKKEDRIAI
jgi:hypothetical protein